MKVLSGLIFVCAVLACIFLSGSRAEDVTGYVFTGVN